jgi:hypothetical protein
VLSPSGRRTRARKNPKAAMPSSGESAIGIARLSNQLSNDRPRRQHTSMDISGPCAAAHGKDMKARAADSIP